MKFHLSKPNSYLDKIKCRVNRTKFFFDSIITNRHYCQLEICITSGSYGLWTWNTVMRKRTGFPYCNMQAIEDFFLLVPSRFQSSSFFSVLWNYVSAYWRMKTSLVFISVDGIRWSVNKMRNGDNDFNDDEEKITSHPVFILVMFSFNQKMLSNFIRNISHCAPIKITVEFLESNKVD